MFPEIVRDDVFRLETRRLWLRWPRAADAPAVAAIASRKEVADMTANVPHPYPEGSANDFILRARGANSSGEGITLVATGNGGSRKVIGVVSVVAPGDRQAFGDDAIRLGYYFAPEEWGRGYATEAVQAVVDGVFMLTGTKAIVADSRVVNPASSRVLQKCGFAFQGSSLVDLAARGGFFPVDTFRLDRKVWASLKGWATPDLVRRNADGETAPLRGVWSEPVTLS
jgi:RimJ/RimL family protein N-acetyltransferase